MATNVKNTKRFKALVALLDGDEQAAITHWNALNPTEAIATDEVSPEVAKLIAGGFSREQAEEAVARVKSTKKAEPVKEAAPLTSKEVAEALVAKQGLVHTRGRVYVNTDIIEAQVRVLKTGKPEIVKNAGDHHTKAVVIWRMDDEQSVAVQNLGQPS